MTVILTPSALQVAVTTIPPGANGVVPATEGAGLTPGGEPAEGVKTWAGGPTENAGLTGPIGSVNTVYPDGVAALPVGAEGGEAAPNGLP